MGAKEDDNKKKEEEEVISTAVYKAYLHCPQCAQDIQTPILSIPGVQSVKVKLEKNEITVEGSIDAEKVKERVEKWSKKKVELISVTKSKEQSKEKATIRNITMKAYFHCEECRLETDRRLIMHRDIYNVKTDRDSGKITIRGVIKSEELMEYIRKSVHKYAEIKEVKEEKKEKVKEEKSKEKAGEFEFVDKVEVKYGDSSLCFIHYAYDPQLFSDENPNACAIM